VKVKKDVERMLKLVLFLDEAKVDLVFARKLPLSPAHLLSEVRAPRSD
jgi:hypothetical protein